MPLLYERDDTRRRIVFTFDGEVSFDEAPAWITRQIAEGAWRHGTIIDARRQTSRWGAREMRWTIDFLAGAVARHGPRGPVAYVVTSIEEVGRIRAYLRMITRLQPTSEIFGTIEDAHHWLDQQTVSE